MTRIHRLLFHNRHIIEGEVQVGREWRGAEEGGGGCAVGTEGAGGLTVGGLQ